MHVKYRLRPLRARQWTDTRCGMDATNPGEMYNHSISIASNSTMVGIDAGSYVRMSLSII